MRSCLAVLALAAVNLAHADTVQLAVASNFTAPMKELAARFEQNTGHKVLASYGATGKFYAQIKNGAPFDVLLAADDETPAKLEKEGAAVPATRFTYAIGKLVLWSAQAGMVDDKGAVLASGKFDHLSIASPKLAPYGAAAVEVLRKLNLGSQLESKLVQGENIAQAYQFVATGAAPLGFVAMSQVMEGGKLKTGSVWVIPSSMYAPIRQDAVALAPGKGKTVVSQFLAYLASEPARAIIRSYGYDL